MAVSSRRVVITGIGVLTPIGLDASSYWEGLRSGKCGIGPIRSFDVSRLPSRIGGEIANFDAKKYIRKEDRKSLRVMARAIQLAVAGAQLALDASKIDKEKLDPTRLGVEFGAGLIPSELVDLGPAAAATGAKNDPAEVNLKTWGEKSIPAIPPLWMLKYLPNMLACHISILHNAQGPNNSITEGDVSSLLAIGEASRILRRDLADYMLVGGADSKMNPLSMVRQCVFGHLSQRNDAPDKACRPFDRRRDGLVPGEGAGVLALEDLDHAQKRGATIWAEVIGFGAAFDRGCKGSGVARAVRAALAQARLTPDSIDHVNAQGYGSVNLDAWEARNLHAVFGEHNVPVWAVKSYIGNLGAASGTVELAASLLAMKHGVLPATLNYEEPDPACPVQVNRSERPITRRHFLKVGYTEMGQCAAVVCRNWE